MENITCIVSAALPFPPVSWWRKAVAAGQVLLDPYEHYQKMSFRNRYYLAAPGGRQLLSIPLEGGRNQRVAMSKVLMESTSAWKQNHWKTIESLYGRSPFFEFFADDIQPLFTGAGDTRCLYDWNKATLLLVSRLMNLNLSFSETKHYQAEYPPSYLDLRHTFTPRSIPENVPAYHQVFEDRNGFLPDCSILDLLFCEGAYAGVLLTA